MEDIVAVAVELADGGRRYFMTWGRLHDVVDPEAVEALVLAFSKQCSLDGDPVKAVMCPTLQEARDAPYFYEALFVFSAAWAHRGKKWPKKTKRRMAKGGGIYFLGRP